MKVKPLAIFLLFVLTASGAGAVLLTVSQAPARVETIGIVRETQILVAAEMNGRLERLFVKAGQHVGKGEALAVLASPELEAAVDEAKAAVAQAHAKKDDVLAGVRQEQRDVARQNVSSAESNLLHAQQQYHRANTLAAKDIASQQSFDEASAILRKADANLSIQRAIVAREEAGPTKEEIARAEAGVVLSEASTTRLSARLGKTTLVAPTDGIVGSLVGLPGEVISPGQAVMTMNAQSGLWVSFILREDYLNGLGIDAPVSLAMSNGSTFNGRVTELRPLGEFATWQAARAVGGHDLNSFFVRVEPVEPVQGLEAGMSAWLVSPR